MHTAIVHANLKFQFSRISYDEVNDYQVHLSQAFIGINAYFLIGAGLDQS